MGVGLVDKRGANNSTFLSKSFNKIFINKEKCFYIVKKELIFVLFVVVLSLLGAVSLLLNQHGFVLSKFVVPESVTLLFDRYQHEGKPALILVGGAGGGCDSISGLEITETYSSDELLVNVLGYNFTDGGFGSFIGGYGCTADVRFSEAQVNLDLEWLKSGKKQLTVILKGEQNTYNLFYENYTLAVIPNNAINVISKTDRSFYSTLSSLKILLPPADVAYLRVPYLLPEYKSPIKDYRAELREFAQAKGLIPAEQVYPGFPQEKYDRLYVVSPNGTFTEILDDNFKGELSDRAQVFLYLD